MEFLSGWLQSDAFFTTSILLATLFLATLVAGFWLRREE
jgi:hypothetical protein